MPYYEKRIYYGDMVECCYYFTGSVQGRPRTMKYKTSSERQAKLNRKNSERHFSRLLHLNFSRPNGDCFLTLTYSSPVTKETAKKELSNFLRRLKRFRDSHNMEKLRYICTTEKQSQYHHHLVINGGISTEEMQRLWKRGRIQPSFLDSSNALEDLGNYLTKEIDENPHNKFERKWSCSLHLKQPSVSINKISRLSPDSPTPPEGYYLLPNWNSSVDPWGNQCCRFFCKKLP